MLSLSRLVLLTCLLVFACESEIIPEARIQIEYSRRLQGYPIHISASLPNDIRADDFEFIWDFGDGETGFGPALAHTYSEPGFYTIKLTIRGDTGSETDERLVEVRPSLELIESFNLKVDEPSGLTFGLNKETLWTVSDQTGRIYELDLEGNVLQTLAYRGGDLEGVSFDSRDSTLWLVDESLGSIIHVDREGALLESKQFPEVLNGGGLEGITLDVIRSRIFLLKEKDISAIMVLNQALETIAFERIGFAPDFSGMDYSSSMDKLWLLSHEAFSIYLTDTSGVLISSHGIDLAQPEGLAYDEIDSVFYVVDDTYEILNKYKFRD